MEECWESLGELTEMAIVHWVQHCPNRTLALLKEGRLGKAALREAMAAQEYVYRAKPDFRDMAWEAVRENGILTPEEPVTEPDTEEGETRLERLRDRVSELLEAEVKRAAATLGESVERYTMTGADENAVARAALKEAGLPWRWQPTSA